MDLTIQISEGKKLNIRCVVILRSQKGVYLENHKEDGYYYVTGGRVQSGESSLAAAKREVFEETGLRLDDLKLVSIIENFFQKGDVDYQEIGFVYMTADTVEVPEPFGFFDCPLESIEELDIRPVVIKNLLRKTDAAFEHYITK